MAPRKRLRHNLRAPSVLEILPTDILLDIMARLDFITLIRCAVVCKQLRRDILSSSFIRRITPQVAPIILAHLCSYYERPLTAIHPITPAAASFCRDHLSPFISRRAANLFRKYSVVTSPGGLVVLHRDHLNTRPKSKRSSDICVYDFMTGQQTFFSRPTGIRTTKNNLQAYVLLTEADGIDCSFMMLFADLYGWTIKVQAATSTSTTWGDVNAPTSHRDSSWMLVWENCAPAVLRGGVVHWLVFDGKNILTYDMRTGTTGMEKPPLTHRKTDQLYLATSPDRNLLKLLSIQGYKISVWLQIPTIQQDGDGWSLENVIDIEENLRSLFPNISLDGGVDVVIEFQGSGKRSGDVVLLKVYEKRYSYSLVAFDLKTKEMHTQERNSTFLEIDLPSHLQRMKSFS